MKQTNKKNKTFLTCFLIFVITMLIWSGTLMNKWFSLNKELSNAMNNLYEMQEENNAYKALLDEENETALMEEYARKSGYVYPGERLYIFN